jgi:hypothetical protein
MTDAALSLEGQRVAVIGDAALSAAAAATLLPALRPRCCRRCDHVAAGAPQRTMVVTQQTERAYAKVGASVSPSVG